MLPDGSYRMSLSQIAELIGLTPRNAFNFLGSKTFKSLLDEGYTGSVFEIEPDSEQGRGDQPIVSPAFPQLKLTTNQIVNVANRKMLP